MPDRHRSQRAHRSPPLRGLLLVVFVGACVGPVSPLPSRAVEGPVGDQRAWRVMRGLGPIDGILDVALAPSGRIALADASGVVVGTPAEGFRRIARVGRAVRVRFDARDGVLAVGEQGLVHADREGRVSDRTPRLGQGGRTLVALDAREGWLAVGGEGGLFVARDDADAWPTPGWQRVHAGLAPGLVSDVALGGADADGARPLWVVAGGELHLVRLREAAGRVTASAARLQRPPGRPIGEPVRRVHVPRAGGGVRVLYRRATARLVGERHAEGTLEGARWEVAFPVLPPEATLVDVVVDGALTWAASTSGVLVGDATSSTFERARPPAGARPVRAVVARSGVVLAAAADALLEGVPRAPVRVVGGSRGRMPRDPELARVHARALSHQRLRPREVERMWQGLGRRGWLPSLNLYGGIDYGSGKTRDYDESFSYGQLNALNDRGSARSLDYDAGLALSWDFAELAFPDDSVELSREARQVIGLRDNVLDEINQLYFDRQRALRALSTYADWSDPEAAELRLRALELAAGLDAWTGGWFSAQVELPAAARAAWQLEPTVPRPGPDFMPIAHPELDPGDPVPIETGRERS